MQAINRQIAHYPYHIGQIVFLAKHFKGSGWKSLTVPRNKSAEFSIKKCSQAWPAKHQSFASSFSAPLNLVLRVVSCQSSGRERSRLPPAGESIAPEPSPTQLNFSTLALDSLPGQIVGSMQRACDHPVRRSAIRLCMGPPRHKSAPPRGILRMAAMMRAFGVMILD